LNDRLNMIDSSNEVLSINRQCDLFGVPRSSYYYHPIPETEYNLLLMKEIDQQYLEAPSHGSRLMRASLINKGFQVNRKRISRLMRLMGLETMYPRPKVKTSIPGYEKFPYLLTDLEITTQNQVWGTDITYIPLNGGFLYLVAFLDLYSRFVLSWRLSNSLESGFCVEALEAAFKHGVPQIVNSDQGVQYTSRAYIDMVRSKNVEISMSGKGRCWDNIFVERFWRTIKYDEVYLKQYSNSNEVLECINDYIIYYNEKRPHSALNYRTPMKVYLGK
jgi:putative transposase